MRIELSEEQKMLQESVRRFAEEVVRPRAKEIDESGEFPRSFFDQAGGEAVIVAGQGNAELAGDDELLLTRLRGIGSFDPRRHDDHGVGLDLAGGGHRGILARGEGPVAGLVAALPVHFPELQPALVGGEALEVGQRRFFGG